MATEPIDFTDDILDMRDVKARYDELGGVCLDEDDLILLRKTCEARGVSTEGLTAEPIDEDDPEGPKITPSIEDLTDEQFDIAEMIDTQGVEAQELDPTAEDKTLWFGTDYELPEYIEINDFIDDAPSDASLIHDNYFETYARQLAEDIGAIDDYAKWPCNCIDWKEAAKELQTDYSSVEINGETYWYSE